MASGPPEIFDRALRRVRRDRAAASGPGFLANRIADEMLDRLSLVTRAFPRALVLGCGDGALGSALVGRGGAIVAADGGLAFARRAGGVQCDEDRLPFADASVDLVVWPGGAETVNDLPGALVLVRRILKPDGLFLAAFVGAGSLPRLRAAMLAADAEDGGARARIHPQIDVRAAGDLLARAGFALPVADGDRLAVRYTGLDTLLADLRSAGCGNLLADRAPPSRRGLAAARAAFLSSADPDGRVTEMLEIVTMTGWAPGPGQPAPARRGSASVSLADALPPRA